MIENRTLPVLYEAPVMLEQSHFSAVVCRELGICAPEIDLREWDEMLARVHGRTRSVTIALVGKYVQLHDAYLSVAEALHHAGYETGAHVCIRWIDSETITEENVGRTLSGCCGVIVPGGFGNRGIEGKIITADYCRTHDLPYLGICLGMQVAVIAFARYAAGLPLANSGEFDPDAPDKVIDFLPDQNEQMNKGGTLRLGAYPCRIVEGTQMHRAYGCTEIMERHRHRYEFSNDYRQLLADRGLVISGTSPDGYIVETVEIPEMILHRRPISSRIQKPAQPPASVVCRAGSRGTAQAGLSLFFNSTGKNRFLQDFLTATAQIGTHIAMYAGKTSLEEITERFFRQLLKRRKQHDESQQQFYQHSGGP